MSLDVADLSARLAVRVNRGKRRIMDNQQLKSILNANIEKLSDSQLHLIPNATLIRLLYSRFPDELAKYLNLYEHQKPIFDSIVEKFVRIVIDETGEDNIGAGLAQPAFGKTYICALAIPHVLHLLAQRQYASGETSVNLHAAFVCGSDKINAQIVPEMRKVLSIVDGATKRAFVPENLLQEYMRRVCVANESNALAMRDALVVIATPQLISSRYLNQSAALPPVGHFSFCILDECDFVLVGERNIYTLEYFRDAACIAISATPQRFLEKMNIEMKDLLFRTRYEDLPLGHRKRRRVMLVVNTGRDPVTGEPVSGLQKKIADYVRLSTEEISYRIEQAMPAIAADIALQIFDQSDDAATKLSGPLPATYIAVPPGFTTQPDVGDENFAADDAVEIQQKSNPVFAQVAKTLAAQNIRVIVVSDAGKQALRNELDGVDVEFITNPEDLTQVFAQQVPICELQTTEEYADAHDPSRRRVLLHLQNTCSTQLLDLKNDEKKCEEKLKALINDLADAMLQMPVSDGTPLDIVSAVAITQEKQRVIYDEIQRINAEKDVLKAKITDAERRLAAVLQRSELRRRRTADELRNSAMTSNGGRAINFRSLCFEHRKIVILDIRSIARGANFPQLTYLIPLLVLSGPATYEQLFGRIMRPFFTWAAVMIEFDYNLRDVGRANGNLRNLLHFLRGCSESRASLLAEAAKIEEQDFRDSLINDIDALQVKVDAEAAQEEVAAAQSSADADNGVRTRRGEKKRYDDESVSDGEAPKKKNVEDDGDWVAEDGDDDDDDDSISEGDPEEDESDAVEEDDEDEQDDAADYDDDDENRRPKRKRSMPNGGARAKRARAAPVADSSDQSARRLRTLPRLPLLEQKTYIKMLKDNPDHRVLVNDEDETSRVISGIAQHHVLNSNMDKLTDACLAQEANVCVIDASGNLVPQCNVADLQAFAQKYGENGADAFRAGLTNDDCRLIAAIIERFQPAQPNTVSPIINTDTLRQYCVDNHGELYRRCMAHHYTSDDEMQHFRNFLQLYRNHGCYLVDVDIGNASSTLDYEFAARSFDSDCEEYLESDEYYEKQGRCRRLMIANIEIAVVQPCVAAPRDRSNIDNAAIFAKLRAAGIKVIAYQAVRESVDDDEDIDDKKISERAPYLYRFL